MWSDLLDNFHKVSESTTKEIITQKSSCVGNENLLYYTQDRLTSGFQQ
jgi:hypothetical protein